MERDSCLLLLLLLFLLLYIYILNALKEWKNNQIGPTGLVEVTSAEQRYRYVFRPR